MILRSSLNTSLKIKIISSESPVSIESPGYSFILIQSGSVRISEKKDAAVYGASDLIFLLPDEKKTIYPLKRYQIMSLHFDRSLLDALIPNDHILTCDPDKTDSADRRQLFDLLTSFSDYYKKPEHNYALMGKIYELLDLLSQGFIMPLFGGCNYNPLDPDSLAEEIKKYIAANYASPLTAKELAQALYISPRHLTEIFHTRLNTTFSKYLSQVRLSHAASELAETDQTVTDIAMANGFSSIPAFFRLFNEAYHLTPTAYRKEKKSQALSEETPLLTGRKKEPPHTTLPFSECTPSYASWSDTINAGELGNALSGDFHRLFPEAQKSLHFRYVRFINIFSGEFLPKESWESRNYPFTRLDHVLDLLIQNHALPFFELSLKPAAEKRAEDSLLPPFSVCLDYLDALIRHCISRYNISIVSGFRFELLAQTYEDISKSQDPEEYLSSYVSYKKIIKSLLPDASFGGPGFNTASDPETLRAYLRCLSPLDIRPDFVSLHLSPFESVSFDASISGKERSIRLISSDPDHALKSFHKCKEICEEILGETAIYITEISPGQIVKNHLGSSAFSAAWLCHNFLSLYKETDCLAYWNFFEHDYTLPMMPRTYSTGSGLFDKHGLKRPSFFALELMNRLKSRTFMVSSDLVCATNNANLFQMILTNYSHYTKSYCCSWYNQTPVVETYSILKPGTTKKYTLSLAQLPKGHYRMTRHRLSRSFGSLLDIYIRAYETGRMTPEEIEYQLNNLEREDIEYYSSHIAPMREITYLNISKDSEETTIEVSLEPFEVSFIQLDKKQDSQK